jgi:hypothetical protein
VFLFHRIAILLSTELRKSHSLFVKFECGFNILRSKAGRASAHLTELCRIPSGRTCWCSLKLPKTPFLFSKINPPHHPQEKSPPTSLVNLTFKVWYTYSTSHEILLFIKYSYYNDAVHTHNNIKFFWDTSAIYLVVTKLRVVYHYHGLTKLYHEILNLWHSDILKNSILKWRSWSSWKLYRHAVHGSGCDLKTSNLTLFQNTLYKTPQNEIYCHGLVTRHRVRIVKWIYCS